MVQRRMRLGIVAPGRAIDRGIEAKVTALANEIYGAGQLELVFHPQCFLQAGHFAGPDGARADAFAEMANDPDLDAIWFARGGYGACRLLDIAFDRLGPAARLKTYLGYSDTGSLLARLYKDAIGTVAHGPMPSDITRPGGEAAIRRSLDFLLEGDLCDGLEPATRAPGNYAAFNITVLANLIGTPWVPDLSGHVLLLEDVGEYHYSLDRMLFNITSSREMRGLAGLRLGRCNPVPENDIDFGSSEEEIAAQWCARRAIPYLGRADIGHDADNKVVVFGARQ
ncbi:MAG: LD-carboxypeptidase [Pannonibacter sp.]